jgi:hypothetical protein
VREVTMAGLMPRISAASIALVGLIGIGPSDLAAQAVANMYDRTTVVREQPRLASRINQIWTMAFKPHLTPDEQRALSGVTFQTPVDGDPVLGYYSETRSNTVTMPAISLLFFEDLCTAYAWLQRWGYRLETIEEYLSMLKYKDAAAFGGRYPTPRKALGIPDDALSDQGVSDLSLRLRNTGWAFILGHELGHLRFRHTGYNGVPVAVAQANETQADQFGLELMRRVAEIPMGAVIFFQSGIFYFENRADFPSDGAWQSYLTSKATHPLTGARLRALSTGVRAFEDDFARGQPNRSTAAAAIATARLLGDHFATFATFLDDPVLQRGMRAKAERSSPTSLLPRRERGTIKDLPIR